MVSIIKLDFAPIFLSFDQKTVKIFALYPREVTLPITVLNILYSIYIIFTTLPNH